MSTESPEVSFLLLRPACISVAERSDASRLLNLERLLKSRSWPCNRSLCEYCLFPLVKSLNEHRAGEAVLVACASCLKAAFEAFAGTIHEKVFFDVLKHLIIILSSKDDLQLPAASNRTLSEEAKTAFVLCFPPLVLGSGRHVLRLTSSQHLPVLGHCITLLLNFAESELSRSLRVAALHAADCLCNGIRNSQSALTDILRASSGRHQFPVSFAVDNGVDEVAARSLANYLPGIASSLAKVLLKDDLQGQNVLRAAIYMWATIVAFVLNDKFYPSTPQGQQRAPVSDGNLGERGDAVSDMGRKLSVPYDQPIWWQSGAGKLLILVKEISRLARHDQYKVRLFMVNMASTLLHHCKRSLECCVDVLVEILVGLSADSYSEVSSIAHLALESFSQQVTTGSNSLVSFLERGLYSVATALPTTMRNANDQPKVSILLLLQGYLQLLGPKFAKFLSTPRLANRLFLSLLKALEIDTTHASISVSQSRAEDEAGGAVRVANIHLQRSPLAFKHFHDEAAFRALRMSCLLVGYYGDLSIVLDSLLDILLLQQDLNKEVIWMINTVMAGAAGLGLEHSQVLQKPGKTEDFEEHIQFLLREYTQPTAWQVATEPPPVKARNTRPPFGQAQEDTWNSTLLVPLAPAEKSTLPAMHTHQPSFGVSAEELRSNVVLVCLLIEGVEVFAKVLKARFRQFLLQSLFPILEKSGNQNLRVRDIAYVCLATISNECGYRSVGDLISTNADYILNLCTQHLCVLHRHDIAARVMKETLSNADVTLLPLLHSFLDEVLYVLESSTALDDAVVLIPVLRAAVGAVHRWSTSAPVSSRIGLQESSSELPVPHHSCTLSAEEAGSEAPDDVQTFISNFLKHEEVEDEIDEEREAQDEEDGNDLSQPNTDKQDQADLPKILPDSDRVAVRVLAACANLLAVADVHSRLHLLAAVEHGLSVLHQNQEELLPLVHQLWPSLRHRVQDGDLPVATKAVNVVAVMTTCAGDFMRSRIMSEWVPVISKHLKQAVPAKNTQLHSLLIAILDTLCIVCVKLDLPEKDIVILSNLCSGLLSQRHPPAIQQAAIRLYRNWTVTYGDCVWFLLAHILEGEVVGRPAHHCFASVKVVSPKQRMVEDVCQNARVILECLS